MMETGLFHTLLPGRRKPPLPHIDKNRAWRRPPRRLFAVCVLTTLLLSGGCSPLSGGRQGRPAFEAANILFSQGSYQESLATYEQIIGKYPAAIDRVLFEMGVIHAHPKNENKDYEKSLECFQKIITDHPESSYRQDSELMIFYINNVIIKDQLMAAQQTQIDLLRQDVKDRESEILGLQRQIEMLEQKVFAFAIQAGPVDKILIEKSARRLMLISRGEVIKTYKIALGGDPEGPKERQGDHKTPEGTYFIDAKNRYSQYHLSLRISYPNEADRKRAMALGVSPGGDIMIHGIKNGFGWVGDAHAEIDWTKGCIAVTNEEVEEIDKIAPIGTVVEIRP
jgi:tetratricopeptide (TPR) repeat protein